MWSNFRWWNNNCNKILNLTMVFNASMTYYTEVCLTVTACLFEAQNDAVYSWSFNLKTIDVIKLSRAHFHQNSWMALPTLTLNINTFVESVNPWTALNEPVPATHLALCMLCAFSNAKPGRLELLAIPSAVANREAMWNMNRVFTIENSRAVHVKIYGWNYL